MNGPFFGSPRRRLGHLAGVLLLALLSLAASPQTLGAGSGSIPSTGTVARSGAAPATLLGPPLAAHWWNTAFNTFAASLNTRTRLIQFGAIGMALALFIIWYRKP